MEGVIYFKRVVSSLVDYFIIFILFNIICILIITELNIAKGDMQMAPFVVINMFFIPLDFLISAINDSSAYGIDRDVYLLFFGVMFFVELMYFTVTEISPLKASIGYTSFGIVLEATNDQKITISVLFKRNILKALSRYCFAIPFLVMTFTKNKQTVYDKAAKVIVVEDKLRK